MAVIGVNQSGGRHHDFNTTDGVCLGGLGTVIGGFWLMNGVNRLSEEGAVESVVGGAAWITIFFPIFVFNCVRMVREDICNRSSYEQV